MKTTIKKIGLLIALLFTIPPISAYDFEVDGIYYNLLSATELTCEVTKGDTPYIGEIIIPSTIEYKGKNLKVISIDEYTFQKCEEISKISIPNSIESIEKYAFSNSNIKEITIPESVREINEGTFCGCSVLERVSIPNEVRKIGWYAFESCSSLKEIHIPDSVKKIEYQSFLDCSSLNSVILPNGLTEIEDRAFRDCTNLKNIDNSTYITSIGKNAFEYCENLIELQLSNSLKYIDNDAFSNCKQLKEINIPDSIHWIGSGAFYHCTALEEVTLPNTLSEIRGRTFSGCSSFQSISIPASVKEIGMDAFRNCSNLHTVCFETGSETLYLKCNHSSISDGYSGQVFKGCDELTTLIVGRSVVVKATNGKYPDNQSGLDNIKNLKLLNSNLSSLLGDILPFIDNLIFSESSDPSGLNFESYNNIKSITEESMTPPGCPVFSNTQYLNTTLYVPENSLSQYMNSDGWKNFWDIRIIGDIIDDVNSIETEMLNQDIKKYNLNGNNVNEQYKGLVIIHYSDGTTKKIIQK